jgi:hypothetical protein
MEHFVTTGTYKGHEKLDTISKHINELCIGRSKAHHIWTEDLPENVYSSVESVRTSEEVMSVLQKAYPKHTIENVRESDEIYWAVSPKGAKGSDRSLVDCHYDAPFSIIPVSSTYYRVIIACNENNDVITSFPNDDVHVKMNTGEFHGLDYNTDYHCVEGSIPPGKYRVLLKLHYMIIPEHLTSSSLSVQFTKFINVLWTKISRWFMRASAEPSNPIEYLAGLVVNVSRVVFNNNILSFSLLGVFIAFLFRKRIMKLLR